LLDDFADDKFGNIGGVIGFVVINCTADASENVKVNEILTGEGEGSLLSSWRH
jgi:hypothetical protein